MNIVSMVLLCVASNVDNLSAAVALGLRSVPIPPLQNAVIAAVTVVGTFVSMAAGALLTQRVARAAGDIGAVAIIAIAASTILRSWNPTPMTTPTVPGPETTLPAARAPISFRATIGLAVALAVNNVITGVGAGATGLSPGWTALLSGLVSVVFVGGGDRLALSIAVVLSARRAGALAGALLAVVGVYELVT